MRNDFSIGMVFLLVGIVLIVYLKNKKRNDIYDAKGYIGGFGSILFGIYLIFQSLNFSIK